MLGIIGKIVDVSNSADYFLSKLTRLLQKPYPPPIVQSQKLYNKRKTPCVTDKAPVYVPLLFPVSLFPIPLRAPSLGVGACTEQDIYVLRLLGPFFKQDCLCSAQSYYLNFFFISSI
jgi:hypothetical protein